MKPTIGFILCVAAAGLVRATDPALPQGRVLVLDNDRTIVGEIDQQGAQYRVRRGPGETIVPAAKVRRLCADLDEAYLFLRAKANLEDPDERLRLARWCQTQGLRSQGQAEAEAALQLRPRHAESLRLLQLLRRPEAVVGTSPPARPTDSEAGPRPLDFNSDALGPFVTKVQPILMNACACCHANGKGGAFQLTRTYDQAQTHPRATQQNLAAVLAQMHRERPQGSPLLTHSLAAHGTAASPPLSGREIPAYRTLEEWVVLATKGTGEMKRPAVAAPVVLEPPAVPGPLAPKSPSAFAEPVPELKIPNSKPLAPVSKLLPAPAPAERKATPAPENKAILAPATPETITSANRTAPISLPRPRTEPTDPFDPAIFNQQMHPER